VSHAGAALVVELADRGGLTAGLLQAMSVTRERRSAHDPGRVLRDVAVMLADGGDCVTDLEAYRGQERLFGPRASETTTHRVLKSIDEQLLERIRAARAAARARVWDAGTRPETITLNIDATLISAHSDKELAAGTYKHGYGFHPICCYLDETGEALAAILKPGNAGSNTAEDHFQVLGLALDQLPAEDLEREILTRAFSPTRTAPTSRRWNCATAAARGSRTASAPARTPACATSPQHAFEHNQTWLELSLVAQDLLCWTRLVCLEGELASAEPKRLRHRLLRSPGGSPAMAAAPASGSKPIGPGPRRSSTRSRGCTRSRRSAEPTAPKRHPATRSPSPDTTPTGPAPTRAATPPPAAPRNR
jgi:DDE family transposase